MQVHVVVAQGGCRAGEGSSDHIMHTSVQMHARNVSRGQGRTQITLGTGRNRCQQPLPGHQDDPLALGMLPLGGAVS